MSLASAVAREQADPPPLTRSERTAVLAKIAAIFGHYYPDRDLGKEMIARLEAAEARGEYNPYADMTTFTARLTRDMREISRDDHITVRPYEPIPEDLADEMLFGSPADNFGFERVALLPGNVGYIKLASFTNTSTAAPTAIAAMNFVAHCDALIFDLRSNGGGDSSMAKLLSSYLFPRRTRLVDVEVPSEDRVQQVWTLEWVPGPRLPEVPVYVLLDQLSYSCSESFAFGLQQSGRAVVVGERTRGGAHAVKYLSFPEVGLNLRVPYTTTVKPGTRESFVAGVVPDVPASSEKALAAAGVRAVSALLARETDGRRRFTLEWALAGYRAELEPAMLDRAAGGEYAGSYGESRVGFECGRLQLIREGRPTRTLVPLGQDDFMFEDRELAHYRVRFTRDRSNRVDGLFWHDGDGDSHPHSKREK